MQLALLAQQNGIGAQHKVYWHHSQSQHCEDLFGTMRAAYPGSITISIAQQLLKKAEIVHLVLGDCPELAVASKRLDGLERINELTVSEADNRLARVDVVNAYRVGFRHAKRLGLELATKEKHGDYFEKDESWMVGGDHDYEVFDVQFKTCFTHQKVT